MELTRAENGRHLSSPPQGETQRRTGKVKFFSNQKGWGFITREDGRDVFVHYSSIRMEGYRSLQEGDLVTYELLETDRGPQAVNVERVPDQHNA
ncbi:MAG: cold shock domain-containing protein [Candidatus Hydrogenedentes bacterium]|nr:cold shock domain-containing protein [Candidatus Hydrogenedentota bacterium]